MKRYLIAIAAAIACFTFSACDSKAQDTDTRNDPSSNETSSSNDYADEISSESDPSQAEDPDESESPADEAEIMITLSGDPSDQFVTQTDCYAQNDQIIIYFQKGVTVRGDMLEIVGKAMSDLSDTTGFDFNKNYSADDMDYLYMLDNYFEPGVFAGLNADEARINVLTVDLDGNSAWADGNTMVIDQTDYDSDIDNYGTIYHELSHVIQFRNGVSLGGLMNEGYAAYTENKARLSQGIPAWTAVQFYFPTEFDESLIYGGEDTFTVSFDDYDINYQYGFIFITFLYDTYGDDIFSDILAAATKSGFDASFDPDDIEASIDADTQELIEIIKAQTADDVFDKLAQWYDLNWADLGQEYLAQVEAMGE